jgi:Cytochrome P450
LVSIPIRSINRSEKFWGPDAKEFKPERWIEGGIQGDANEIQGYRHLLSFADGPKMCLGKPFALATFKVHNLVISGEVILIWLCVAQAALLVLIRLYVFELRDGPDTQIEVGRVIRQRPKVVGENESCMPLRIRRVD